jgi:hypothetical protein
VFIGAFQNDHAEAVVLILHNQFHLALSNMAGISMLDSRSLCHAVHATPLFYARMAVERANWET